jgi:catalase
MVRPRPRNLEENQPVSKLMPFAIAAGLALIHAHPARAQETTPDQVVREMEGVFGVTPGQRRNHIKGTCAAGEFVGTAEAAALSRSPLFTGATLPVIARFSLPSGNPKLPDTTRGVRGMALQFKLPKDDVHHMAMLNVPVFGASNPKTFHNQLIALKPDPATGKPDPEKLKAFRESHPDTKPLGEFLAKNNPPASYASAAYFSIHTFKFLDAAKKATPVRWRFVPQAGEKLLTDDEMKTLPADFLEARLMEEMKTGPARWDMILTVGQPGDPETDPTQAWPKDRREFKGGTLTLSSATPQKGAPCEPINFDPLAMAAGIEPTDDPILMFRSPAYAVSFTKRFEGK